MPPSSPDNSGSFGPFMDHPGARVGAFSPFLGSLSSISRSIRNETWIQEKNGRKSLRINLEILFLEGIQWLR